MILILMQKYPQKIQMKIDRVTTLSGKNDKDRKENLPTNARCERYNLRPTPT